MKILIFSTSLLFFNCSDKNPSLKMTDEYIEVKNDPSLAVIYEVNVLKFDSALNYPTDETVGPIYSIVNRKSHKPPKGKFSIRMYFSKQNEKYCWEIMNDPTIAHFTYQDTFTLKKNRWYKIRNENDRNEMYFFWTGVRGDYITKIKPLPGPGPY